ncbi:hypothetical protein AUJ46_03810 [Candidatus Peregrinibacteria bacterium CG1_02_54_53]|nr:MAG: hypothetical protein AUJ46_03810 [Candidatus Peregrinibacteria bacterium CG1_02_54_53]
MGSEKGQESIVGPSDSAPEGPESKNGKKPVDPEVLAQRRRWSQIYRASFKEDQAWQRKWNAPMKTRKKE